MRKSPTTDAEAPEAAESDTGISRVVWAVAAIGVVASAIAGWVNGARALAGVGIGAFIALSNLLVLSFLVRRLVAPRQPKRRWAAAAALKLAVLLGGVFWLVNSGQVPLFTLIVGYAALPLGILVGQLLTPAAIEEQS